MAEKTADESAEGDSEITRALEHVRKALRGLNFGEVILTVQDGIVVQLERTERTRLQRTRRR
jgi:hypothetical protein